MTNQNNHSNGGSNTPVIGGVYDGVVVGIQRYGAFVNFGFEQDGLVPIREISDSYIESVESALSLKQAVKVKVVGFDHRGFPKLSIKAVNGSTSQGTGGGGYSARPPRRESRRPASIAGVQPVEGMVYNGVVTKILNFGAFVDFGFGLDGMVHISHVAPTRIPDVESVLSVEEAVKVKFLGFDDQGRVKLSIKEAAGQQGVDGPLFGKAPEDVWFGGSKPVIGAQYHGNIVTIIPTGLFVNFGFARDGLVHIREISDEAVQLADMFAVGGDIVVKVLSFDERGRPTLSCKQVDADAPVERGPMANNEQ